MEYKHNFLKGSWSLIVKLFARRGVTLNLAAVSGSSKIRKGKSQTAEEVGHSPGSTLSNEILIYSYLTK